MKMKFALIAIDVNFAFGKKDELPSQSQIVTSCSLQEEKNFSLARTEIKEST